MANPSDLLSQQAYKSHVRKFSIKLPEREAARVRENQRRHRAKVKARIAELETSLATTQDRLGNALRQIEELTAEVQRLRRTLQHGQQLPAGAADQHAPTPDQPNPQSSALATTRQSETPRSSDITPISLLPESLAETAVSETPGVGDESREQRDRVTYRDELANNDCPHLPVPKQGESTITCRDAYAIIVEQALAEVSPDAVWEWLRPGLRQAITPGGGCRVQTHMLFAFVDRMTSL